MNFDPETERPIHVTIVNNRQCKVKLPRDATIIIVLGTECQLSLETCLANRMLASRKWLSLNKVLS